MAEVASAFVSLMPSARGFGRQLDAQIGSQIDRSGKTAGGRFGRALGSAASFVGVAGGIAGVGLAVGAVAKKSVGLEADFSSIMNQMGAVANVPQRELSKMSDLAIQMGRDTVFSASDAAGAMLELAKNGIDPATIRAGALKEALTLAAAGGVSMEEAAATMGNALNAFGLQGKDAGKVSAALAGAANASSASIGSLSQGLAQAATGASQAGLTVQETTAALAAFSNAGIQGSDAGTSLKTFLQRLVPQGDKATNMMQDLGLASFNAKVAAKDLSKQGIEIKGPANIDNTEKALKNFFISTGQATEGQNAKLAKLTQQYEWSHGIMDSAFTDSKGNFEDLSKISGSLQDSLSGLSDDQRTTALNTLFGADASRAAAVLMKQGSKGIDKYTKATSDQGAAQRVAAARMKGTAGSIEAFKGSLETAELQLGKFLAPAVQAGLGILTNGLNALPGIVKKVAGAFSGGGGGGLAKFAGSMKATAGTVIGFAKQLLPTIQDIGGKIMATIGPAFSQISGLIMTQLLPAFRKMLPILLPVAKFLLNMFGSSIIGLIQGFVQVVKGAINIVAGVFKLVVALVHGDWAGAWKAVVQIAKGAFDVVLGAIKVWFNWGIFGIFKSGAKKLLGSWRGIWDAIKGVGSKALGGVKSLLAKGMDAIGRLFGRALGAIGRGIWAAIKGYFGLWRRLLTGLRDIAVNGWRVLRSAFGGAFAAIKTVITNAVKAFLGFWRNLFTRFRDITKAGIDRVIGFFKGLPGRITGAVGNLGKTLFDKGKDIVRGLIEGIKSMAGKLAGFVKKFVVDHIPGPIAKAMGLASPSKVTTEQGRFISLGLVKGIESQQSHVDRVMTKLSNRIQVATPKLHTSLTTGGTAHGGRGGQEIRGTLGIDRDGVAYIHGVSRTEVHFHAAAREAADRAAAMSL